MMEEGIKYGISLKLLCSTLHFSKRKCKFYSVADLQVTAVFGLSKEKLTLMYAWPVNTNHTIGDLQITKERNNYSR